MNVLATTLLLAGMSLNAWAGQEITVYKSPTCGCCNKWVKHLEDNGFDVKSENVTDVIPYKIKYGVTPQLASCHTAVIAGYTIEGHVPASDIKRLLKEKPAVQGLSVPRMPVGTPGMEQGSRKDPYQVISFDRDGRTGVFADYSK
jgi:hypothetical protein